MFFEIVKNSMNVPKNRVPMSQLVRIYSRISFLNVKPNLYSYNTYLSENYLFSRKIHNCCRLNAKTYRENENNHLYQCINSSLFLNFPKTATLPITHYEQFYSVLNQNWRHSTASEIVVAFQNLRQFCVDKEIPISDPQFDKLVDGLMDHCEKLTDNQILELLCCLAGYPPCESYSAHNFHDVWSCLDDICCWKMHSWNMDKVLDFADAWFNLNLTRYSDFVYEVLERNARKAEDLTKNQLVRIFFLFNNNRRRKVDFEYEYALQSKIRKMNVDEMAVVALGYFKTESKVKISSILEAMMDAVIKNSKTIHEVTLSAILKTLRLSKPLKSSDKMTEMLDKLVPEIDRLSDLACLHLALVPTGLLLLHEKSLKKCAEKLSKNMENIDKVRVKEIERVLNALTMFGFDPKIKPDIFKTACKELQKAERVFELEKHPRCLISSLNYLSMVDIYSFELMDKVLDMDHVNQIYGKMRTRVPRELFSLDRSIEIDCPEYPGKRLPLSVRYKATKWFVEFVASKDQYKKITAAEQLVLDVIDTSKRIVKNEKLLYVSHVLPHFPRADVIFCKNKKTNKFVEPLGFENYILGDIKVPFSDENLVWYALMILGWNNTIRDTSVPLGLMLMKERQLKKIGYKPIMVIWNQFQRLSSEDKENYILEKLK